MSYFIRNFILFLLNLTLSFENLAAQSDIQIHLINEINFKVDNLSYNSVVEIPAGSNHKWEVNKQSGKIEWEKVRGISRIIDYLPYPGSYGFFPQTIQSTISGGDGDPADVIILGGDTSRGEILKVNIIGSIKLLDSEQIDDKYIAVIVGSKIFKDVDSIDDITLQYPGVIEIIRLWFLGYKGNEIEFIGYNSKIEAIKELENSHDQWLELNT